MKMSLIAEAEYVKDNAQRFLRAQPTGNRFVLFKAHSWRGRLQLAVKFLKCALVVLKKGSASVLVKKDAKQC